MNSNRRNKKGRSSRGPLIGHFKGRRTHPVYRIEIEGKEEQGTIFVRGSDIAWGDKRFAKKCTTLNKGRRTHPVYRIEIEGKEEQGTIFVRGSDIALGDIRLAKKCTTLNKAKIIIPKFKPPRPPKK